MKRPAEEIIDWGRCLFERKLISGWGGNISCRFGKGRFLITCQHAPLGFLNPRDLVEIDGKGKAIKKGLQPSSETPLHLAVYSGTDAQAIIHAHPPMVLAFSLAHDSFVPLSFEEKYTIGEVSVIPQETPTVVEPEIVVKELNLRPIVILRGHGTVAAGRDLREALLLTDLLEQAIHCKFLESNGRLADPDPTPNLTEDRGGEAYALFSPEHIAALAEIANRDVEFQKLGGEEGLTTTLALAWQDTETRWTFHFADGRIADWQTGGEAEFVISGKREYWEAIFQGRLDPFMATQQGKLKLIRGELWRLSRWFRPFHRAFTLWQTIPIR